MKRKLLALSLVFVFLFVSGCKKATDVGSSASRNSQSLSYKQFEKLVSDVEKKLNLGSFGLKIIRSTVRNPIVVHVDKGMSFGKREWITLKGEAVNSTQEQLIYENDIKGYRLITTWIYQEISIGNNLLMLKPPEKDIAPNVFDSILSYNNILIHVQTLPTGKKNTKPEDIAIENGKIIIELNNYLKKYKI